MKEMPKPTRQSIRVGQRLINWDGTRGYVSLNSKGTRIHGPGDSFQVDWLDWNGEVESSEYYTLDSLHEEGITFGRGVMPWAR